MLVWLASYPRSGNTLLRQVLKHCFDLRSCDGLEPVQPSLRMLGAERDAFYGAYSLDDAPEEFYERARASHELVLIKTHQPPRDNEKAIYVVRDGRLALRSYATFQDEFHPGTTTVDSLMVGDHVYGEWTGHYRSWLGRTGDTLVVRFEELTDAGPELLMRLGAFLEVPGPVRPWINRQAELQSRDPEVFGAGDRAWRPDAFWTATRLRAFYTLHGPLLAELGYATAEEVRAGVYPPGSEPEQYLRYALGLAARTRELQRVCDERLDEIGRLKHACDERLDALHAVTREAEERSVLLRKAADECERLRARLT